MRSVPRLGLVALSGVVLSACSEPVLDAPMAPNFAVASDLPIDDIVASNHFVVFNGPIPEGFESDVASLGAVVAASYGDLGVAVVSGLDDVDARALKRASRAAHVELEPMLALDEPVAMSEALAADAGVLSAEDPTTAFFYAAQWNMRAIDADQAWAAGRLGESSTTVAILDTGIDYLHNDLNGLVDLGRSVSFVPSDDAFVEAFFPGRHPITDLRYHGTHVASTVASNGEGAAGVTSGVTLVGVKVCNVFGSCPGSAVFGGVAYAAEIGADVANMSLGGSFSKREFPGFVSAVQRLFNSVGASGLTMVVSAGNASADLDHDRDGFKTYCGANVVCVSATGPTAGGTFTAGPFENPDAPSWYSNFGRSGIDVAAPGGNITSVLGACSTASLFIPVCQTSPFFYVGLSGTSMAAPHTSGVAALISEDVGRNPGLIRARLQQSADDLGQSGVDPFYGKGRINAGAATGS